MQGQSITDTASLPVSQASPSFSQDVVRSLKRGSVRPDSDRDLQGATFDRFIAQKASGKDIASKEDGTSDLKSNAEEAHSSSVDTGDALADHETPEATWQVSMPMPSYSKRVSDGLGYNLNSPELSMKAASQRGFASDQDKAREGSQIDSAGSKGSDRIAKTPDVVEDQSLFRKVRLGMSSPTFAKNAGSEAIAGDSINPVPFRARFPDKREVPSNSIPFGDLKSSHVQETTLQQTQSLGGTGKQSLAVIEQSKVPPKLGKLSGMFAPVVNSGAYDTAANTESKTVGRVSVAAYSSQTVLPPSLIPPNAGTNSKPYHLDKDVLLSEAPEFTNQTLPAERGSLQSTSVVQASASSVQAANAQIMRQIVDSASALTKTGGSVELTLNPKELGKLRMVVSPAESGGLVYISTERAETLELVQRNLEMLRRDLKDAGWSNVAISLADLSLEGSAHQGNAGSGAEQQSTQTEALEVDDISEAESLLQTSKSVRSGLDMRV